MSSYTGREFNNDPLANMGRCTVRHRCMHRRAAVGHECGLKKTNHTLNSPSQLGSWRVACSHILVPPEFDSSAQQPHEEDDEALMLEDSQGSPYAAPKNDAVYTSLARSNLAATGAGGNFGENTASGLNNLNNQSTYNTQTNPGLAGGCLRRADQRIIR